MLARAQSKRRKIQENEKDNDSLTFPPPTTRRRSNASVMGELVCCFRHEINFETNLCIAGAYHTKRTKTNVKHVLTLTKKWIDMVKVVNDDVFLRKLSDGDLAVKELYYHTPEVKSCLQTFARQYDQALRKSERSIHDVNDDTRWIKINALNTVYSFVFEEVSRCRSVPCEGFRTNILGNSLGTWNSR